MLTLALYGLLAIVLAAVLFLLAAYVLPAGEQLAPALRDEPLWDLPPGRALTGADIAAARLPVALRGYRFAETDRLLDRLAEELDRRDAEIARLRGAHDKAQDEAQDEAQEKVQERVHEKVQPHEPQRPDDDGD